MLVASLLNLDAVVAAARASGADDVAVLCAGVEGAFAIDDAYVAGRIAQALGGEPDDAAVAAVRLAGAFATAEEGIGGGISADEHPPTSASTRTSRAARARACSTSCRASSRAGRRRRDRALALRSCDASCR